MGKIKLNRKDNYTIISNSVLKNKNLSLKAKGLYAYMWSLPDDWDYSVAGLVTVLKEGKDAINEALKELEREGYLVRTILRKGGKFSDMDYILHEFPQKVPFTENPQAEKPFTENPQQLNTNKTKEKETETKKDKSFLGEQAPLTEEKPLSKQEIIALVFEDPNNAYILEALRKYQKWYKDNHIGYQGKTVTKWAKILRDNAGEDPALAMAIVDQSIKNGWKSLYPLKKYGGSLKPTAVSKKWDGNTAKDEHGKDIVF